MEGVCDWASCWRSWHSILEKDVTTLNPKGSLKLCLKHTRILQSLDRKVRRMRGMPPLKRKKPIVFGAEDITDS